MYKVYRNSDVTAAYVVEIVADANADISNLPTNFEVGSTCLVLEDTSVYMLGNDKEWHKI